MKKVVRALFVLSLILTSCSGVGDSSEINGYLVKFDCDGDSKVYAYRSSDYSYQPTEATETYSRNGTTGLYDKTGNGQTDFYIEYSDGYELSRLRVFGDYESILYPSETNKESVYRVTGIKGDLLVDIQSRLITDPPAIENISSIIDENGKLTISWDYIKECEKIEVIYKENNKSASFVLLDNETFFEFNLEKNKSYTFHINPFFSESEKGEGVRIHKCFCPDAKKVDVPRIEISTKENILPYCEYVQSPKHCAGNGISNNNDVESIVLFEDSGTVFFNSKEKLSDKSDVYSGAKINIFECNASYDGNKKAYELKLEQPEDLLSPVIDVDEVDNTSTSWVLYPAGNKINNFIGQELSDIIANGFKQTYSYISLFINGDYSGLYILSNNITKESCKVSNDGFVVENNACWWNQSLYFQTPLSDKDKYIFGYTFKYPYPTSITDKSEKYTYISNYISEFETKLLQDDKSCLEMVDIDSFSQWLLIQDLLSIEDAAGTNMFCTKYDNTNSSRLKAGPAWNFDSSLIMVKSFASIRKYNFYFISKLSKLDLFINSYNGLFNRIRNSILNELKDRFLLFYSSKLDELIELENKCYGYSNNSFKNQFESAATFLEEHIEWMSENI